MRTSAFSPAVRAAVRQLRDSRRGGYLGSRLSISGKDILDPNGVPIFLRGINQGTWGENSEGDALSFKMLGANCARVVFRWWGLYGTPDIDSRDDGQLDYVKLTNLIQQLNEIKWLVAQGLWVIVALDSNCGQNGLQNAETIAYCDPAGAFPTTGRNFWSDPATREFFKMVWKRLARELLSIDRIAMFELLPEPREGAPAGAAAEVRDFYRDVIAPVRQVDSRTPFLIGARDAYNVLLADEAWLSERTDVVYTGNILSGKMTNQAALATYIKALTDMRATRNVPVLVQQVGRETSADPTLVHLNSGLSALNANGIHWTYWQWKQNTSNPNTYGLNYKDGVGGWVAKTAEQARLSYYLTQTYEQVESEAIAAATAANAVLDYIRPNLSNVWQGPTQASPVTTLGQTVSRLAPVVGSIVATQNTSTAAPTLTRTPPGYYAMLFDGVDDWLQKATAYWATNDDVTVVAAGIPAETATNRVFLHSGSSGAVPRYPYIGVNASDVATAMWRDDAGTFAQIDGTLNLSDRPVVLSGVKSGNNHSLYTQGLQEGATTPATLGTVTFGRLRIGSATTTTGYFQGAIALTCMGKAMTTAQRQAIERFGAFLVGAAYAA